MVSYYYVRIYPEGSVKYGTFYTSKYAVPMIKLDQYCEANNSEVVQVFRRFPFRWFALLRTVK
jgi:hypothetical protein